MEENNEVIQEFSRKNPIDTNKVIEEYSNENKMTILDKINEWYRLREKVGTEHTFGDLEAREKNLKVLQDVDADKLNKLSQEIDALAKKMGVEFDSKTGMLIPATNAIQNQEKQNDEQKPGQNNNQTQQLDNIKTGFDTTSNEYNKVTEALYGKDNVKGNENQNPEQKKEDEKKKIGIVEAIKERKLDIMERDADAKKILQELVKVQAAKDRLDMHIARHVVEKNRLMIQIMQTKLALMYELAHGAKRNDMKVQILETQLNGLVNSVSKKETEFEQIRGTLTTEFNFARNSLGEAKKTLEIDQAGNGSKNKYNVSYSYSEDGVMNSAELNGRKDDKTVHEKELYDQRGIMVFDNLDTINGHTSIMVDGKVVNINSSYTGNGEEVSDSAYIDGMEVLETSSNGIVEEKPDIDELNIPEKTAEEIKMSATKREPSEVKYVIDSMEYRALEEIPPELRVMVGRGLVALELVKNGNVTMPAIAETRLMINEAVEKDKEEEIEAEENPSYPGMPPMIY